MIGIGGILRFLQILFYAVVSVGLLWVAVFVVSGLIQFIVKVIWGKEITNFALWAFKKKKKTDTDLPLTK